MQQITFSFKNRKLNSTEEQTVSELKNLPSVRILMQHSAPLSLCADMNGALSLFLIYMTVILKIIFIEYLFDLTLNSSV